MGLGVRGRGAGCQVSGGRARGVVVGWRLRLRVEAGMWAGQGLFRFTMPCEALQGVGEVAGDRWLIPPSPPTPMNPLSSLLSPPS